MTKSSKRELVLGPGIVLPAAEAATRSYGILGMKGSGKSNMAVVLAEELTEAGVRWVTIDIKGDWYGVRSAGNGKGAGLPVVIFGGPHKDVPIEPTAAAGRLVADVILDEKLSAVIDIHQFSQQERIEFLAGLGNREGFAGHFFDRKAAVSGIWHLFLEEAHKLCPQQPDKTEAKLVRRVGDFQTMGRQRGLGCSVLSQRSAKVHKDLLTQSDVLIAFRTIGPQDRDAIGDWLKYHGAAREVLASLAALQDGEAWLWSPEWLQRMDRVKFRVRWTYDSGATPSIDDAPMPKLVLADIDLGAVTKKMAATIEKLTADDPERLKAKIRELEARKPVAAKPPAAEVRVETKIEVKKVEVPLLTAAQRTKLTALAVIARELRPQVDTIVERCDKVLGSINGVERDVASLLAEVGNRVTEAAEEADLERRAAQEPQRSVRVVKADPARTPEQSMKVVRDFRDDVVARRPVNDSDGSVSKHEQKLLDALAWLESIDIDEPELATFATTAKYTVNGHFKNMRGALKAAGLIDYPSDGKTSLTAAGRRLAQPPQIPLTVEGMHKHAMSRVSESEQRILQAVLDVYPSSIALNDLAVASGYTVNGHFKNMRGHLRSLQFIDYPKDGETRARDFLFLKHKPE